LVCSCDGDTTVVVVSGTLLPGDIAIASAGYIAGLGVVGWVSLIVRASAAPAVSICIASFVVVIVAVAVAGVVMVTGAVVCGDPAVMVGESTTVSVGLTGWVIAEVGVCAGGPAVWLVDRLLVAVGAGSVADDCRLLLVATLFWEIRTSRVCSCTSVGVGSGVSVFSAGWSAVLAQDVVASKKNVNQRSMYLRIREPFIVYLLFQPGTVGRFNGCVLQRVCITGYVVVGVAIPNPLLLYQAVDLEPPPEWAGTFVNVSFALRMQSTPHVPPVKACMVYYASFDRV